MANMVGYIKNLSKSVGYSTLDSLKESNPKVTSFIDTNENFMKVVYKSIKDYKKTSASLKKNIKGNEYYKAGIECKNNLFEDLKSGNFYNKERIKRVDDKMMGSMFGNEGEDPFAGLDDIGSFDNITSDNSDDWSLEDISGAIDQVGEKTSTAISNVTARSAEYIVESNKAGQRSIVDHLKHMGGQLSVEMDMMNSNIANLINFNNEAVKTHIENSTKFFETSTVLDQERNKTLTDILEVLKTNNGYTKSKTSNTKKKKEYEDLVDAEGMVDIESYAHNILDNINTMTSGVTDMLTVFGDGDSNMIHALVASPLKVITDSMVKSIIPKMVESSMEEFNKSLGGVFGSLMLKLNSVNEFDDSFFKSTLSKIFGVESKLKTKIDTSKFNRGPLPWDGESKKALIEIIPGQLATLISAVSGKEAKLYDYETGKYRTESDIRKESNDRVINSANSATFDTRYEIKDIMDLISFNSEQSKKDLQDTIDTILQTSFTKGKMFNHRKLNNQNYDDWGITNPDNINMIKAIFENVSKSNMLEMNSGIMSRRQSHSNNMKELEKKGGVESSLYNGLFDDRSNTTNPLLNNRNNTNNNSGLLSNMNLVSQKDHLGNNIFFYMQNMNKELILMRTILNRNDSLSNRNNSQVRSNGNRRNRNRGIPSNRNTGTVIDVSDNINDYIPNNNPNIRSDEDIIDISNSQEERYNRAEEERRRSNENIINESELADGESSEISIRIAEAIKNNKNNARITSRSGNESILDQLVSADTLGKKVKVFSDRLGDMIKKPATFMAGVLHKADERMFDLVYGREGDPDDRSLITKLFDNMKNSFTKFNDWLDDTIFKPMKAKFTKENMHSAATKFFGMFGIDFDGVISKTKKYLFGEKNTDTGRRSGGLFGNFMQGTKDNLKGFGRYTRNSFRDVYSPLTGILNSYRGDPVNPTNEEYNNPKLQELISRRNAEKEQRRQERNNTETRVIDEEHSGDNNAPAPDIIQLARGTKYVPKTMLATLTEGEAVIPREFNPFYNNKKISKQKQIKDEDKLAKSFFDKYGVKAKGFAEGSVLVNSEPDSDTITTRADSKILHQPSAIWGLLSEAGNRTLSGLQNVANQLDFISASDEDREKFKKQMVIAGGEVQKSSGAMGAGAIIGVGTSLLTGIGGPLVGAAAGAAIGLIKDSKMVREALFGVVDENGNRTKTGLIKNNTLLDGISKYLPDMTKYGLVGGLTAMLPFIPGGPLAGIMLGSTIGFAKNNESAKNYLFGNIGEDGKRSGGIIGDTSKLKQKIQSALPNMTAGAIGGLLLGPFGLAGNVIFGSALGYATSTEKFKTALFGQEGEDGKREGGIIGSIKTHVIDPLSHFVTDGIASTKEWFSKNIFKPLADAIQPIKKQISLTMAAMFGHLTASLSEMFNNTVGAPLNKFLEDKVFSPMTRFLKWTVTTAMKPAKFIAAAPFKAIGAVGNHFKKKQIADGNADYITAAERNEFRDNQKRGLFRRKGHLKKDKFREFDENLENMNIDDMTEISNKLGMLKGSKTELLGKQKDSLKAMSDNLYNNKNIDYDTAKSVMKRIKDGDYKKASKILRRTDISDEERDNIFKLINKEGTNLETLKEIDKNKGKVKNKLYDKLKDYGFNDINDKNLTKYDKLFKTEIKARKKSPEEELLDQSNIHHTEIVDLFRDAIEQLRMMNDPEYKEKIIAKKKKKIEKETHKRKGIFGADYGYRDLVGEEEDDNDETVDTESNDGTISGYDSMSDMVKNFYRRHDAKKAAKREERAKRKENRVADRIARSNNNIVGSNSTNGDEADKPKKKNKFMQYVSDMKGRLIKLKTNSQGETVPDTNDSQTDDTKDAQAKEDEVQNNINNNLTNLGSTLGNMFKKFLFGKDDKEDKTKMDYLKAMLKKAGQAALILGTIATFAGMLPILDKFWKETAKPAFVNWFKDGPAVEISHWLLKNEKGILETAYKIDAFGKTVVDVIDSIPEHINNIWTKNIRPFLFGDGDGSVTDIFENRIVPFYLNGLNFIAENIVPIGARLLMESIPVVVKGLITAVREVLTFDFSKIIAGFGPKSTEDQSYVVEGPGKIGEQKSDKNITDDFIAKYNKNLDETAGKGGLATIAGGLLNTESDAYYTATERLKEDPTNVLLQLQAKNEKEAAKQAKKDAKEKEKYKEYTKEEFASNSTFKLLGDSISDNMNYERQFGYKKNKKNKDILEEDPTYSSNVNEAEYSPDYTAETGSMFAECGTSYKAIDKILGSLAIEDIIMMYEDLDNKSDRKIIKNYVESRNLKEKLANELDISNQTKKKKREYSTIVKELGTMDMSNPNKILGTADTNTTIEQSNASELNNSIFTGAYTDLYPNANNIEISNISKNETNNSNNSISYIPGATRKTQKMLDTLKANAITTDVRITNNEQALAQEVLTIDGEIVTLEEAIINNIPLSMIFYDASIGQERYVTGNDILVYQQIADKYNYNIDEGKGPVDTSSSASRSIGGVASKIFVKSALGGGRGPVGKVFTSMAKNGIPGLQHIPLVGKLMNPAAKLMGGTLSVAEKAGMQVNKRVVKPLGGAIGKKINKNVINKQVLNNKVAASLLKEGSDPSFLGKFIARIRVLIADFLTKPPIGEKLSKLAGKGTGGFKKVVGEVVELFIKKLMKILPPKIPQLAAKIGATVASVGVYNVVAACIGAGYGWDNANNILGVIEQPNAWIRLICAIVSGLSEAFLYGIIPLDLLVTMWLSIFKNVFKVDTSAIDAERQAAVDEVTAYNKENNTDMTVSDYNNKDKIFTKAGKATKKFFVGTKVSDEVYQSVKEKEMDTTESANMLRQIALDPGIKLTDEDKAAIVQEYNKEHKGASYTLDQYDELAEKVKLQDKAAEEKADAYKKKHTTKGIVQKTIDWTVKADKDIRNWFGERGRDVANGFNAVGEGIKNTKAAIVDFFAGKKIAMGYYETSGSGCYYLPSADGSSFDYFSINNDKLASNISLLDVTEMMRAGQLEEGEITIKDAGYMKMLKSIKKKAGEAYKFGLETLGKAKDGLVKAGHKAIKALGTAAKNVDRFFFGTFNKAYFNSNDGSYYTLNEDKKSYSHFNTHGDLLEEAADGETVSAMIQTSVLKEGVLHGKSGLNKLINKAVTSTKNLFKDGLAATKKALTAVGEGTKKAFAAVGKGAKAVSDFLIGKVDITHRYSDGSFYRSNGKDGFTYYNANGDILAEDIPYEKIEAELKTGILKTYGKLEKSGLNKKLEELGKIGKDIWNETTKVIGTALTDVKTSVVDAFSDISKSVKEHGLIGGLKNYLFRTDKLVYFDHTGSFYQYQKSKKNYTYFNANWDIIAENIPTDVVDAKLQSDLLKAGTKEKDSAASDAIKKINKSIGNAWDTAKNVVSSGWDKFTKWLGISGGGSGELNAATNDVINQVQDGTTASSLPNAALVAANAALQSTVSGDNSNSSVDTSYNALPNSYARGSKVNRIAASGSGFVSQLNKKNVKYGTSNLEESGCGPAVAANLLNRVGIRDKTSIEETARYALNKKYVNNDGATDIGYFNDILSNKGNINTTFYNNSNKMYSHLRNGNPVIMMGTDPTNTSKKYSPYGQNPHYVIANSLSNDGKYVYIDDPESKRPNKKYPVNKIFSRSVAGVGINGNGSKFVKKIRNFGAFGTSDNGLVATTYKIIHESEGDYGSVNKSDGRAFSVGKLQWNAGRAKTLLQKICKAVPNSKSILGDYFYGRVMNSSSWENYGSIDSSTASKISKLLLTPEGKSIQDQQAYGDVAAYLNHGKQMGLKDTKALMFFADLENQGGGGGAARVLNACGKPASQVTLSDIYKASLRDSKLGPYKSRRDEIYKKCGGANPSNSNTTVPQSPTTSTPNTGSVDSNVVAPTGDDVAPNEATMGITNPVTEETTTTTTTNTPSKGNIVEQILGAFTGFERAYFGGEDEVVTTTTTGGAYPNGAYSDDSPTSTSPNSNPGSNPQNQLTRRTYTKYGVPIDVIDVGGDPDIRRDRNKACVSLAVGEKIASKAYDYVGKVKYKYGADNIKVGGEGDCSSFTRAVVAKAANTNIGRDTISQMSSLRMSDIGVNSDPNKMQLDYEGIRMQAGDLIYWTGTNNRSGNTPSHVGIYTGGDTVVHNSSSSGKVVASKLSEYPLIAIKARRVKNGTIIGKGSGLSASGSKLNNSLVDYVNNNKSEIINNRINNNMIKYKSNHIGLSASGSGVSLPTPKKKIVTMSSVFNGSGSRKAINNTTKINNINIKTQTKKSKGSVVLQAILDFVAAIQSINTNTSRLSKLDKITELLSSLSNNSNKEVTTNKNNTSKLKNGMSNDTAITNLRLAGIESTLKAVINNNTSGDIDSKLDALINDLESIALE